MLIRWANEKDIPIWEALSREYDQYISKIATNFGKWYQGINEYMNRKIKQHEAVIAIDRMADGCNGAIAFSRSYNRITFFAISPAADHKETAERLLKVALRQLNSNKDITINLPKGNNSPLETDRSFFIEKDFVFVKDIELDGCPMSEYIRKADNEKRGGSFHYRYPEFIKQALNKEHCPCITEPDDPYFDGHIINNEYFWACGEYPGQGRLFGKMFIAPKEHYFHFEDMPEAEAAVFMNEVRRVGRALRKVTGAVKINYEMHSNSGAHLHIHLFPRYLDDDFPGMAIDVLQREPAPYESYDEYLWFIEQMRMELAK